MRGLDELINVDDAAWPEVRELFTASAVPLTVLPVDINGGRRGLLQPQITARSVLGSLVLNSGGLVVDGGWIRVFGGGSGRGCDHFPSLAAVNAFPRGLRSRVASGLVVAHDILGGVFALNGHDHAAAGRPGQAGQLTYFAPDTLQWEALAMGHSAWLSWLLSVGWRSSMIRRTEH